MLISTIHVHVQLLPLLQIIVIAADEDRRGETKLNVKILFLHVKQIALSFVYKGKSTFPKTCFFLTIQSE